MSQVKRPPVTQPTDPSYRIIPLTRGKIALVDTKDYEELSKYKWSTCPRPKTFYAQRSCTGVDGKSHTIFMHRQIMKPKDGKHVDHINHNGWDNRRRNMRTATRSQNGYNQTATMRNTSGFKGVSFVKRINKWQVAIRVEGRKIHIGNFDYAEEAGIAYQEAAKLLHGEFAKF